MKKHLLHYLQQHPGMGRAAGGGGGGGGPSPLSLPHVVDWSDNDISDLTDVTDRGRVATGTYYPVLSASNPTNNPSGVSTAYPYVVRTRRHHPSNISTNAEYQLGGALPLAGGIRVAIMAKIETDANDQIQLYATNGLAPAAHNYFYAWWSGYGTDGCGWGVGENGSAIASASYNNYASSWGKWNQLRLEINFETGASRMYAMSSSNYDSGAMTPFTPVTPPSDVSNLYLNNRGGTSTWYNAMNYGLNQYIAAYWFGSLTDDWPTTNFGTRWTV